MLTRYRVSSNKDRTLNLRIGVNLEEQDMKALKLVFGVYTLQKTVLSDSRLVALNDRINTREASSFIQERLIGVFDSKDKASEFASDPQFLEACRLQNKQISICPFVWNVSGA